MKASRRPSPKEVEGQHRTTDRRPRISVSHGASKMTALAVGEDVAPGRVRRRHAEAEERRGSTPSGSRPPRRGWPSTSTGAERVRHEVASGSGGAAARRLACAACTNSRSRSDRISARTKRAVPVQLVEPDHDHDVPDRRRAGCATTVRIEEERRKRQHDVNQRGDERPIVQQSHACPTRSPRLAVPATSRRARCRSPPRARPRRNPLRARRRRPRACARRRRAPSSSVPKR